METIKDFLLVTLLFPPVILLVITIHELGHYFAARLLNVRIGHFSVGFGREVWRFKNRHGISWIIKSFPVCGHLHLAGNSEEGGGHGRAYSDSPLLTRMLVVMAGPLTSLILPFLVFFIALGITGLPIVTPVINGVEINEVAYNAGILPGDRIIEMNGRPVRDY